MDAVSPVCAANQDRPLNLSSAENSAPKKASYATACTKPAPKHIQINLESLGWNRTPSIRQAFVRQLVEFQQPHLKIDARLDPTDPMCKPQYAICIHEGRNHEVNTTVETNPDLLLIFNDMSSQMRQYCMREMMKGIAYARQEAIYDAPETTSFHKEHLRGYFKTLLTAPPTCAIPPDKCWTGRGTQVKAPGGRQTGWNK